MNNRKKTALYIAKSLKQALIDKFGKVPSATVVADQFNLRAYGTSTITRETARKWILGLTVPEIDKLIVLTEWLDLDITELFKKHRKVSTVNKNIHNISDENQIEHHIQTVLKKLNDHSKNALFLAALALKELESNDFSSEICHNLINHELLSCKKCRNNIIKFN